MNTYYTFLILISCIALSCVQAVPTGYSVGHRVPSEHMNVIVEGEKRQVPRQWLRDYTSYRGQLHDTRHFLGIKKKTFADLEPLFGFNLDEQQQHILTRYSGQGRIVGRLLELASALSALGHEQLLPTAIEAYVQYVSDRMGTLPKKSLRGNIKNQMYIFGVPYSLQRKIYDHLQLSE